jgi:adenylylsulfate kinase-like enzyme
LEQIKHTLHNYRVNGLKRNLLKQRAVVVWITGLPASGKSTLASILETSLLEKGYFTQWLDGDFLRNGLTSDLDFSDTHQEENVRRCAEVAKLFWESGIITICTFISQLSFRSMCAARREKFVWPGFAGRRHEPFGSYVSVRAAS